MKLSKPQRAVLFRIAERGASNCWFAAPSTLRSLEASGLIRTSKHHSRQYVLTDKGREALTLIRSE